MNSPKDRQMESDRSIGGGGGAAMIRKMKRFLFAVQENRVQDVEIVKQFQNGRNQYRLRGLRTGKENQIDIIDRSIPFASSFRRSSQAMVKDLIYWSFVSNFWIFAIASVVLFVALNVLFSFLIVGFVERTPECISTNLSWEEMTFVQRFYDAFHLSWTTFSTVGYGLISPATGANAVFLEDPSYFEDENYCLFISFLLSFESLVGVLFVSFCSAVIFGKLTSFQTMATCMFSSVMVVDYGDKDNEEEKEDLEENQRDETNESLIHPYPTITFRIVNLLHSQKRGEILDASVNVVATIEAKNAIIGMKNEKVFSDALVKRKSPSHTNSSRSDIFVSSFDRIKNISLGAHDILRKRSRSKRGFTRTAIPNVHGDVLNHGDSETINSAYSDDPTLSDRLSEHRDDDICIQVEEPDQPNMVFATLKVSPSQHPFFRSTWHLVHTLDGESPLLKKKIRKLVRKTKGWPTALNSHQAIKDAIHFDNILVTFKGTSNISGASVFDQTTYKMDSLRIGFEFKSVLMQNVDGSISVRCADVDQIVETKAERHINPEDIATFEEPTSLSDIEQDQLNQMGGNVLQDFEEEESKLIDVIDENEAVGLSSEPHSISDGTDDEMVKLRTG